MRQMVEELETRLLCYSAPYRWFSTANQPFGTGSVGDRVTLTYSFVPNGTTQASTNGEPNAGSTVRTLMTSLFGTFEAGVKKFYLALTEWTKQANVDWEYEPNDD